MRQLRPALSHVVLWCSLLLSGLAQAQGFRFTTLDIGQGDAAVLVAPGGCAVLFDGGPTGSGATIKAYLKSLGVTRIDLAFVSHLHEDHIGGIDEVDVGTNAVPISTVYDHGGSYSSTAYSQYNSHFSGKRRTAVTGQTFSLCNQVTLKVVATNANGASTTDENARSVAVKISYGAFDALVGGDLPGSNGDDIESLIASSVGGLELYKVHHHGSRYSSNTTFLGVTQPLVSFISVGVDNPYGHPTSETLARLGNVGSDVWQTEDPATNRKNGHIELTTTAGSTFTVRQGSDSVLYTSKGVDDSQPPTSPGSLVASAASSSEIDLSWSASTDNVGVTGYTVYRSTDGSSFSPAGTSSTTGFANLGLSANTPYWYRVTARDAAGNESTPSNTASATTTGQAKVILNEILANEPGSSTAGEFVELVNVGSTSISIGGWTISVGSTVRHTFAAGTTLGAGKAIVVFAGASGIPSGLTNAVAASSGGLSLLNSSATVTVKNGQTIIDSFSYTSSLASTDGVSMNRGPDASATGAFVLHTTLSSLDASGGKRASGSAF